MDFQAINNETVWLNNRDAEAQYLPSLLQPYNLAASSQITPSASPEAVQDCAVHVLPIVHNALHKFTTSTTFLTDIQIAFGSSSNLELADSLIDHLAHGMSWPEIQSLPYSALQADGAYGGNAIFMSEDLLINPKKVESAVAILLEEVGHYVDTQINQSDAPGDEGAIFAKLVLNQSFQAGELESLKAEDDHGILGIQDLSYQNQVIAVEHSNPLGVFVVGTSGQVSIDFLADAGSYRSEMAIFSLEGMDALTPGSVEFIKEASRRALSNSTLGYVSILDPSEGARFTGDLGESNKNDGPYPGPKNLNFKSGDRLALMLVPQGTVNDLFLNPNVEGDKRPLFSMSSANPNFSTQLGQLVSGAFGWEDLRLDQATDADYNDVVFQIKGATGAAADLASLIAASKDWRSLPTAQEIIRFASAVGDLTLKLSHDTGLSSRDGMTSDPSIEGSISSPGNLRRLSARFNETGNFVDITSNVDAGGAFQLEHAALSRINSGSPLVDGSYRLNLEAEDSFGSLVTATFDFVLDTTKPAAPSSFAIKNDKDLITNQVKPVISGKAENNTLIELFEGFAKLGQATVSDEAWETDLSKEFSQGVITLTAQATDLAGNMSEPVIQSLTIDTEAPVLTIISPLNNGTLTNGSRLRGSINGTGSNLDLCSYSFNGSTPIQLAVDFDGNFDQALDLTGLGIGLQNLTVKAVDLAGNVSETILPVNIAQDKIPFFVSDLQVSSNGLFVGEAASVGFSISVANPAGLSEIQVYEVDSQGALSLLGTLLDDGDLDKGDDILGDGLYNSKFTFTPTDIGEKSFVAVIPSTLEKTPITVVSVVSPLSEAQFQQILDFNAQIDDQLMKSLESGASASQSLAEIKTVLESSGDKVKVNSIVTTDRSILWENQEGIVCMLNTNLYQGDQKSGEGSEIPLEEPSVTTAAVPLAAEAEGCNHALVLSPYAIQFEPYDEANEIAQKFRDAKFSVVEKSNAAVTVEDFKNLQQYTAIAISSHGDNFDGKTFGTGKEVVVLTGQKTTAASASAYSVDLLSKRLVLVGKTYAVTTSFITKYTDKLPDTIVYVSSCRSTFTDSLANAFLSEGATAFIGYSDYVSSDFSNVRGQLTFDTLLMGKATGDIKGINVDTETDADPATFRLFGSDKATLTSSQLQNGDFEKGVFRCWMTQGDARIITALGPLSPPEGNRMAIISTGLGSVSDSQSSISQSFVVPDNADKLQFTYNVISEEPTEFVGSKFDDRFQAFLDGIEVASESVNSSVWYPVGSIDFAGGDSTVFQTGFKTINLDLSPYIGKKVEFKLATFDKGDSIYDTAALVDNIKLLLK